MVSIFAFFISFVPPSNLPESSHHAYLAILIISYLFVLVLPFILYVIFNHHKGQYVDESDIPKHFKAEDIVKSVPPIARGEFHIVSNDDKDNFNAEKVKK